MKAFITAPIFCFLQFFVLIGQVAESLCDSIEEWASA